MKFVNITENGNTKVLLDLETMVIPELEFAPDAVVCDLGLEVKPLTFAVPNKFLATLTEDEAKVLATGIISMRHEIAKSERSFHGADLCAEELTDTLISLVKNPVLKLFDALVWFSGPYMQPDDPEARPMDTEDKVLYQKDRILLMATELLSALFFMPILDFRSHFGDVLVTLLYPAFENAIRNSGVSGSEEFTKKIRAILGPDENHLISYVHVAYLDSFIPIADRSWTSDWVVYTLFAIKQKYQGMRKN